MAGLLDSMDDPRTMGLLSLGLGLLNSRGSFGQALGQAGPQALQAMQQVKDRQMLMQDRQQQQQMREVQMQQAQAQLAEMQRQNQEREKLQALAQQFARSPQQQAMANGHGPTVANAAAIQNTAPGYDFNGYANALAGLDPIKALQVRQALQKDDTPIVVAEGGALYNRAGKQLASNPKAPDLPSAVREYNFAVQQGYPGTFQQFQIEQKKAGATNIALPKIDIKTGEGLAGQVGPMLRETKAQALSGLKLIDSSSRVLDAAERGGLFAGPGANLLLKGAQVADVLGIAGKDTKEKISNTRAVVRGMAEQAVAARSQLGGQAQISNAEQALLDRATSGDIADMTAGEIVQIAKLNDTLGRQLYSLHQSSLDEVSARPDLRGVAPFYRVPPLPQQRAIKPPKSAADLFQSADDIINGKR